MALNVYAERGVIMTRDKKMLLGYLTGGFLVIGLMPSIIYIVTSLIDNLYRIEIIENSVIRWILIIFLLIIGAIYGVWSIVVQNRIGKGGPLEIGKIQISPKTENLVISGPYKHTRNPMLFGTFLAYLAFSLMINSITSVILVIAIFVFMLTVVVKLEEKRLLNDFGNQYEAYRRRVSKFFPWFSKKY